MDGLMVVGGRRHNADDIVATALAVEPMKFVYRGRYVFGATLILFLGIYLLINLLFGSIISLELINQPLFWQVSTL